MKIKSKKIALYPNSSATTMSSASPTDIDSFINDVRSGRWEDRIHTVRRQTNPTEQEKLKKALPNVTVSGVFTERSDETLQTHSTYIAVDIDHIANAAETRDRISKDKYVYAAFLSCRGEGVCAIVKVDPKAHREAYVYMSAYFQRTYKIHSDPSCKNISRIRYVSYDPDATINPDAIACPAVPKPKEERRPHKAYYFKNEDFIRIIAEIQEKELDLTDSYERWIFIALSLQNKFPAEEAREYFHDVSRFHPDYDIDATDRKFDNLLDENRGEIPIDWFYNLVEQNGIKPYGKDTEAALMFEIFQDDETRDPAITKEMVEQHLDDMPPVTKVKSFLRAKHKEYIRNEFTEELTADDKPITDLELNSFYVTIRERVDDKIQFDLVRRILFSDFVKQYHPFREFLQPYLDNPPENATGHIDRIITAINTDTPNAGIFIKKWLVSMVASAFGTNSPLVLVFCGPQNTGKTMWFKLILPEQLQSYRASLNWSGDRDEVIRMSRNLIMLDDEMGGKSTREEKQIKKVTSIDKEQTRGAYKSIDQSYKRAAIFCGTTNEDWFLSDNTGNRRFLPVYVISMDFEIFNSVDKGLLFHELYQEWKAGFHLDITKAEQEMLDEISAQFTKPNTEEELVSKYLTLPQPGQGENLTATDIYGYLRQTHPWSPIKLGPLGQALKKAGFKREQKRIGSARPWLYAVQKVITDFNEQDIEDLI